MIKQNREREEKEKLKKKMQDDQEKEKQKAAAKKKNRFSGLMKKHKKQAKDKPRETFAALIASFCAPVLILILNTLTLAFSTPHLHLLPHSQVPACQLIVKPSRVRPCTRLFGRGHLDLGLWLPKGTVDGLYRTEPLHVWAGRRTGMYVNMRHVCSMHTCMCAC